MQTFLPFDDFQRSAQLLDKKRCFKQVVEAKQILNVIDGTTQAWKNHPIVKMWWHYRTALAIYHNTFFIYCRDFHHINFQKSSLLVTTEDVCFPWWFGNEDLHYSHRCNLLRKAVATNNKELLYNLAQANITISNHNVNYPYLWL